MMSLNNQVNGAETGMKVSPMILMISVMVSDKSKPALCEDGKTFGVFQK